VPEAAHIHLLHHHLCHLTTTSVTTINYLERWGTIGGMRGIVNAKFIHS
jgi:hypothetical protein